MELGQPSGKLLGGGGCHTFSRSVPSVLRCAVCLRKESTSEKGFLMSVLKTKSAFNTRHDEESSTLSQMLQLLDDLAMIATKRYKKQI